MDEDVGVGVGPSERAQHAGGGGPTPGHRRRMSARRKQDAVLRLLRGEGSGAGLARSCGDGRRAERLAGGFPCRWRGILEEPARRCS